jgi:hypothetical protein
LVFFASDHAYVTGTTDSPNFPLQNPIQATLGGGEDAFVTEFNPTGSALIYSTYLGGSGTDNAWGIAVSKTGRAYVTGNTDSSNFPTLNAIQKTNGGGTDAFVTEINPNGAGFVYSTYLGGSGDDFGKGITVNSKGSAFVTGYTSSSNFPTKNPLQGTNAGSFDVFVTRIYDLTSASANDATIQALRQGPSNDVPTGADLSASVADSLAAPGSVAERIVWSQNPAGWRGGSEWDAPTLPSVGSLAAASAHFGGNDFSLVDLDDIFASMRSFLLPWDDRTRIL